MLFSKVSLKKKAEELLAEIRKSPAKFAELAKQHSQDPGSAAKGGDLGTFSRGSMVKAFDDAVFSIERALAKTSQRASQLRGVTGVRKVDPLTIDVLLSAPDAVLPDKLWLIASLTLYRETASRSRRRRTRCATRTAQGRSCLKPTSRTGGSY